MHTSYHRLEQLVAHPHAETPAGTIWVPEAPVDLEELADLVDSSDADESDDEEISVFDRLEETGHISTLLYFEWSLGAPIAWEYRVSMLNAGEMAYMLHVPDQGVADDPPLVIARLHPGNSRELVDACVADLIGTNGVPYQVTLFGSLPNEIALYRPDLVSRDAVAAGIRRYISQEESAWSDMASIVDMLERGQVLSFAESDPPEAEGRMMTAEEREALCERYLALVIKSER
jgi:hypothetical protein